MPGVFGADCAVLPPPKPDGTLEEEGMAGVLGTAMRCGFSGREDDWGAAILFLDSFFESPFPGGGIPGVVGKALPTFPLPGMAGVLGGFMLAGFALSIALALMLLLGGGMPGVFGGALPIVPFPGMAGVFGTARPAGLTV